MKLIAERSPIIDHVNFMKSFPELLIRMIIWVLFHLKKLNVDQLNEELFYEIISLILDSGRGAEEAILTCTVIPRNVGL